VTSRVGIGYDAHRFAAGRRLVLCGVEVPHDLGLDGHSDADVATHALMDAILGAADLDDIGELYPDSDERFRGASSIGLLRDVVTLAAKSGWRIGNVDLVLILEGPRLAPHRDAMKRTLAGALGVGLSAVGVKATTTEGMGFAGRGEGVAAMAVCLLTSDGEADQDRAGRSV
jgi:2-C-methyl-D-erythritol 2,4-cyclodiphosphate synthase